MPRATCDTHGCARRPILGLPARLVARSTLTLAGADRARTSGAVRLCRSCAADYGIYQLDVDDQERAA